MNLTECLRGFGAKVIKVSPLLKAIVPLMDHRDKAVREEGTASTQQGGWEGCLDREDSPGKGAASTTAIWEASLEESLKTQTVSSLDRWLQPNFGIILEIVFASLTYLYILSNVDWCQVTSLLSGGGGFGGGSSANYGLPSTCPEGVREHIDQKSR